MSDPYDDPVPQRERNIPELLDRIAELEAGARRAWHPIKTAPRDGTDILVARTDPDGGEWHAVAQWWVDNWFFMYGAHRQLPAPLILCFEPTHWQHLPRPVPPEDKS
jgi:hypothetical protein|tara:strand:+ start:748 stop:1068 length:321 start_codon:yes stop_codon:yes gene_type:complete